jgi:hypothetical protein
MSVIDSVYAIYLHCVASSLHEEFNSKRKPILSTTRSDSATFSGVMEALVASRLCIISVTASRPGDASPEAARRRHAKPCYWDKEAAQAPVPFHRMTI